MGAAMSLDPWQAASFLGAALALTVAPGPDNLMILALGLARGRAAGLAFGLGCALGCLSHTALAAFGVGAVIAAEPRALLALQVAGGLYLLWLGVGALRAAAAAAGAVGSAAARPDSLSGLFFRGLLASAINPKVALFFLAFLPQFVVAGQGAASGQLTALGLLFTLQTVVVFGLIGWQSGAIGQALARRPGAAAWLDRLAGVVFIGLGLRLIGSA